MAKRLDSSLATMEAALLDTAAKMMALSIQAAQAMAEARGSNVVSDLCSCADLAPSLLVQASDHGGETVSISVWLHHRTTGAAVVRLLEITAESETPPWVQ